MCRGDTVSIGNCETAEDTGQCFGDQYFVLEAYPYGINFAVAFNNNCKFSAVRGIRVESPCSALTYTMPMADSQPCRTFSLLMACGAGTCGGTNIPIYMPGTPTMAPVVTPTEAPVRPTPSTGAFGLGTPGADEGIAFAITVGCLVVVGLAFTAALRLSPTFAHWFWSLEFISSRFLGPTPPSARQEQRSTNLQLWGYTAEEAASLNYDMVPLAPPSSSSGGGGVGGMAGGGGGFGGGQGGGRGGFGGRAEEEAALGRSELYRA